MTSEKWLEDGWRKREAKSLGEIQGLLSVLPGTLRKLGGGGST